MSICTIVMYHYVRDLAHSRYPKIKGLDLDLFKQQIEFFKSKYNFVSMHDLLNGDMPENAMLLTFDDGYIDHYTNVFPILRENKIKAFFAQPARILAEGKLLDVNKLHFILASVDNMDLFLEDIFNRLNFYRGKEFAFPDNRQLYSELAVASRFDDERVVFVKRLLQTYLEERLRNILVDELFKTYVGVDEVSFSRELYMSYDQIKFMSSEGMSFGIHGYDHYWLGNLTKEEMERDIAKALQFFDGIIDKNNWVMCYPYGSYNDDVIAYISNNGCKMGFTTEVSLANLSKNKLLLPRLDTNDFPPKRMTNEIVA